MPQTSTPSYTHLHCHSEYSLPEGRDGMNKVKELPKTAKEAGMDAIALTDHGVLAGVKKFVDACEKEKVKPIIGSEMYCPPGLNDMSVREQDEAGNSYYHFLIIARNLQGYRNLCKLNSIAYTDGFYYRPRVDLKTIEAHKEGLLFTTACIGGGLAQQAFDYIDDQSESYLNNLKEMFGDQLFLEVQPHHTERQEKLNKIILPLASKLNIPIVGTNDVHYANKADWEAHFELGCIARKSTLSSSPYPKQDYGQYVKSSYEMYRDLVEKAGLPVESVSNSQYIADMCEDNYFNEHIKLEMPKFPGLGEFTTPEDMLEHVSKWGLVKKFKGVDNIPQKYKDRLNYELKVIKEMNYADYFLIVWDYVKHANDCGVLVGPGRGSQAGSLLCWSLGITKPDPIKYDLFFERFVNPERVSPPDADIDFPPEFIPQLHSYLKDKYGHDKFAQIGTYSTFAGKGEVRDLARVHDKSFNYGSEIANRIPDPVYGKNKSMEDILKADPKLKEDYPEIIKTAEKIDGNVRHRGVHACLSGKAKILTSEGYLSLDSLVNQNSVKILTRNGFRNGQVVYSGNKTTTNYKIASSKYASSGINLTCTDDHILYINGEELPASNLLSKNKINPERLNLPPESILAGWIWNDGYYRHSLDKQILCATPNKDDELIDLYKQYLTPHTRADKFILDDEYDKIITSTFGNAYKHYIGNKGLPITNDPFLLLGWLKGFLSANATVQKGEIRIKLRDYKLVKFIRELVCRYFDAPTYKISKISGKVCNFPNGKYKSNTSWSLQIGRNISWKIYYMLGFVQTYKNNAFKSYSCVKATESELTENVYDFIIESNNPDERNGYVDGILVHNCGVIISPENLEDFVPTYIQQSNKDALITQWDKKDIENIGGMKFDLLYLDTLSAMSKAVKLIKERHNIEVDLDDLEDGDENVYDLIAAGHLTGLFQIETSPGMKELITRLAPKSIEELSDLIALYRPGPIDAGFMQQYSNAKQTKNPATLIHNNLAKVLGNTWNVPVYQEQLMQLGQKLAKYSLAEADLLRRAIGKKDEDKMAELKPDFINRLIEHSNFSTTEATAVWNQLEPFANYGFNKAHSISYAIITYQTGWLKHYYPNEYLCGTLAAKYSKGDKVRDVLKECNRLNIPVIGVDINSSTAEFKLRDDGAILYGIAALKGLGDKAAAEIEQSRGNIPYKDIYDFLYRVDNRAINSRTFSILAAVGAFDSMNYSRSEIMEKADDIYGSYRDQRKYREKLAAFNERQEEIQAYIDKYGDIPGSRKENRKRPRKKKKPEAPDMVKLETTDKPSITIDALIEEYEATKSYLSANPGDFINIKDISRASDVLHLQKGAQRYMLLVFHPDEPLWKRNGIFLMSAEDQIGDEVLVFVKSYQYKQIARDKGMFIVSALVETMDPSSDIPKVKLKDMEVLLSK